MRSLIETNKFSEAKRELAQWEKTGEDQSELLKLTAFYKNSFIPGTALDSSTGLMWQKKTDGVQRNWENAKKYCRNLNHGGFSDWKLPNGKELRQVQRKKLIFDPYKISGKWDSSYWTANSSSSVSAYLVNFDSGNSIPYAKKNELNVRCVRGNSGTGTSSDQSREKHKPQNNIVALQQRLAESKYLTHVGHYEGNTYAITRSLMNFEEAKALAQEQGGHLATIDGRSENNFLVEHFAPYVRKQPGYTGKGAGRLYMGLIDITKDNDWGWIDKGEELGWFDFRNWNAGQPNNHCNADFCKENTNEDCAVIRMDQEAPGKWHDNPCYLRWSRAIIEWDEQ